MNRRSYTNILAINFLFVVFSSCSAQADVFFTQNENRFTVSFQLKPAVLAYWNDLQELDPHFSVTFLEQENWKKIIDSEAHFLQDFRFSTKNLSKGQGELSFIMNDWEAFSKKIDRVFTFQSLPEGDLITITLDRNFLAKLGNLTFFNKLPGFGSLVPQGDSRGSFSDYRESLAYLLEPYDPKALELIDRSFVDLRLHLPRVVKKVQGASSWGQMVTCRWPIIRVLTLEQPIKVSILY